MAVTADLRYHTDPARLAALEAPVLLTSSYNSDTALVTKDTRHTFPLLCSTLHFSYSLFLLHLR